MNNTRLAAPEPGTARPKRPVVDLRGVEDGLCCTQEYGEKKAGNGLMLVGGRREHIQPAMVKLRQLYQPLCKCVAA
jgi:hypothetical protein